MARRRSVAGSPKYCAQQERPRRPRRARCSPRSCRGRSSGRPCRRTPSRRSARARRRGGSWRSGGRRGRAPAACSSCPDTASRIARARASASANSGGASTPRERGGGRRSPPRPGTSRTRWAARRPSRGRSGARGPPRRGVSGSRSSSAVSSRPGHEARDEAGGTLDEGGHGRRDAEVRRQLVRGALRLAVDAEQRGVLAGQPHHVVGAPEPHPEVAIGDPAVEGRHSALARAEERGHAGHHLGELGDRYLLVHRAVRAGPRLWAPRGGCQAPPPERCAHAPGHRGPPCPRRPGRWRCPSFG